MEGSQGVGRTISIERDCEPSRIEPELWSRAYQRLVPLGCIRALREGGFAEAGVMERQAAKSLAPAA